jgi:hypothetical protein
MRATVVLIALTAAGCETEEPMTAEPVRAGDAERMDDIPNLRPHIRKLLDKMKSGDLIGANAGELRQELGLADKVTGTGKLANYCFFAIPETAGQEGSPTLVIVVQRKCDRIVRCLVVSCEY